MTQTATVSNVSKKADRKKATTQFFQRLARAFLVPLSLVSAASLMLAIGSIFEQEAVINIWPAVFGSRLFQYIVTTVLEWAGLLILRNMGFVYCIGLAFSLVKEKNQKEYAAFGAAVGYIAFLKSMSLLVERWPEFGDLFPANSITNVLGFDTVNCGILGGILTALICSKLFEKFKDVRLPMAFSFFQGIRFVPIICLITMTAVGQVFPFVWIYIARFIEFLGESLNSLGPWSVFVYAVVERALIPTGLHQVWNALVRTTAISGQYVFKSGAVATGVTEAYANYLKEGLPVSPAGVTLREMIKYQFGPQIPMMLGALPAIALALYQCADADKKDVIKPLVVTGVMCSVFAAVSEPIEFIFLFTAPVLYILYSLLTGLSWLLCYLLGSCVGGGDSSIFGLFVHGILRQGSRWWIVLLVTVFEFVVNYFLFRWYIMKFDVKTPGRGGDYDDSIAFASEIANINPSGTSQSDGGTEKPLDVTNPEVLKAQMIIHGLGGQENIVNVDSCMTRLRVEVKDLAKIDKNILNKTGCSGFVEPGGNEIQIIYGPSVTLIKKTVQKQLGMI